MSWGRRNLWDDSLDGTRPPRRPGVALLRCPICRQLLRVPTHRGDLILTCPPCGSRWEWSPYPSEWWDRPPETAWLRLLRLLGRRTSPRAPRGRRRDPAMRRIRLSTLMPLVVVAALAIVLAWQQVLWRREVARAEAMLAESVLREQVAQAQAALLESQVRALSPPAPGPAE